MIVDPQEVVDRQHLAYNTRDIETYCTLFACDAVISRLNDGAEIAKGIDAIRTHYTARFNNPDLHCKVKMRAVLGDFVIDHEQVTGITEAMLDVIAIYEIRDALIQSIRIIWP